MLFVSRHSGGGVKRGKVHVGLGVVGKVVIKVSVIFAEVDRSRASPTYFA